MFGRAPEGLSRFQSNGFPIHATSFPLLTGGAAVASGANGSSCGVLDDTNDRGRQYMYHDVIILECARQHKWQRWLATDQPTTRGDTGDVVQQPRITC